MKFRVLYTSCDTMSVIQLSVSWLDFMKNSTTAVAGVSRSCKMLQCVNGYFVTDVSAQRVDLFLKCPDVEEVKKLLHSGESLNSQTVAAVKLFRPRSVCVVYGSQLHVVFT